MATISLQNFSTMVENMAAAVQGSARKLLNLTVGSTLRAILEASASVGLWVQYLILITLQATRLATSSGTDVDTYIADFGLTRLPATSASGDVTFSRYTPGQSAFIPVGATVLTSDQTQSFAVVADTSNGAYSATPSPGYTLQAAASSLSVPVQAVNAGSQGNVLAGTISLISSAIPGVDTVTNAADFTNGVDAESDASVRTRFQNWINTRALATIPAVEAAIKQLQQGLTYTVETNQNTSGTYTPGSFVVTVDDGTGATPSATVTAVANAVNAVRPVGSTAYVQAATKVTANVAMTITVAAGASTASAQSAVNAAVAAFIDAQPVGGAVPYSRIAQVAYDSDSNITNITAITLNGATADLSATAFEVIRVGTVTVNT